MRRTLLSLLVLVSACWSEGEEPPGEPVGAFEATGLMVEHSCGAAIPSPDPLDLVFELRAEEGGRAYWRRQGGQMFAGVFHDDEYTFQVSQSWMVVQPDRFRGYLGCSVTQRDVFTFVVEALEPDDSMDVDAGVDAGIDAGMDDELDAGVEPSADAGVEPTLLTMRGSQTTQIVPLTGSDCRPAVAAHGGPFLALPCRVEYVLTGTGFSIE